MLRASVRCQFKCIRCEGVRGRSAAGPPSLSSTLLRYYTASIVHILHIYTYYILYIYIYLHIYMDVPLFIWSGRNRSKKNWKIYIYTHTVSQYKSIYIYLCIYIWKEHVYLVLQGFCVFWCHLFLALTYGSLFSLDLFQYPLLLSHLRSKRDYPRGCGRGRCAGSRREIHLWPYPGWKTAKVPFPCRRIWRPSQMSPNWIPTRAFSV